jgi:anti-sigma factor RsiW
MSDARPQNSNLDQLDEELVAYLDGELEADATKRLENVLASDERARRRLNQLAVSWDLLDQLPRATVDDNFTRTTVEMLALEAEGAIAQAHAVAPAKKRLRWLAGGIAGLLAASVGFLTYSLLSPNRNDVLVRNLPVIANLDLYRSVDGVSLLEELQKSSLFNDDAAESTGRTQAGSATAVATTASMPSTLLIPDSPTERRKWVASLPPEEKMELNRNLEKFIALEPEEKEPLREIDSYIRANALDADQLLRLMQRYRDWLKTLAPAERKDLSDVAGEKRITEIHRLKDEQAREQTRVAFARLGGGGEIPLPDSDNRNILRWMQKFTEAHKAELPQVAPEDRRTDFQKTSDRPPRRRLPQMMIAWETWWAPSATAKPPVTDADFVELKSSLSPEKQRQLDARSTSSDKIALVKDWIQKAFHDVRRELGLQGGGRWGALPGPEALKRWEKELKRFEDEELTTEEKEQLAKIPAGEQRTNELSMLYRKKHPRPNFAFPPPRPPADPSRNPSPAVNAP